MKRRFSQKRQTILELLQKSHEPLSVAQLHALVPAVDLVTIYRNLEYFSAEGSVKKFHLKNGESTFEYQTEPHHHAVCTDCDRVIHFKAPDSKIIKLLGLENFEVNELEVTVRGTCR